MVTKGKLAEAEQMCQRAPLGLQNSLGSEHPLTMIVMNNMKKLDLRNGKEAAERANPVISGPTEKVRHHVKYALEPFTWFQI